jgi:hypothetical protein
MRSIMGEGKDSGDSIAVNVKRMALTMYTTSVPSGAIACYAGAKGITRICARAHTMGALRPIATWTMAIAISAAIAPSQASYTTDSWTTRMTTMALITMKGQRSGQRTTRRIPMSRSGGGGTTA